MNIGVIGAGGVGGYFGGKIAAFLAQADDSEHKIYFLARNKHLEEIKNNGLIVRTADQFEFTCRPTLATDAFDDFPEIDVCLICVKSCDLNKVSTSLKAKIKKDTEIIPLLNGVDIYERVRAIIPQGFIFPACVYIGTQIDRHGKVSQTGGACTILSGEDPENPGIIPDKSFNIFESSNIKYTWLNDNPDQAIWEKYIFIAAYSMVAASENATFGQILESRRISGTVTGLMREIAEIAAVKGVRLPGDIVEESFAKGKNFPHETKTSFQRDFEQKNKPDERELFGNTILKLGESLGVKTPIAKLVDDKLNEIKPPVC